MKHWMRVTVLLQALFFLGWAAVEEYRVRGGQDVVLETEPVDPRDLLSGQYMTLAYAIADLTRFPGLYEASRAAVELAPAEQISIADEPRWVWRAVRALPDPAALPDSTDNSLWVWADVSAGRARYGIERYYFSEARAGELNRLASGRVWVQAKVGRRGDIRVTDLLW